MEVNMAILGKTKNDDKKRGVDLSEIIKGMQHAVNEAQNTLELHHLNSLLSFFHSNGDPKMVNLHIEDDKYIDVPTFTLASHNALKIEELEMQFKARIQDVDLTEIEKNGEKESNANFTVGFSSNNQESSDFVTVRILFKSIDQSEGFARVIDEYNKIVKPYTDL